MQCYSPFFFKYNNHEDHANTSDKNIMALESRERGTVPTFPQKIKKRINCPVCGHAIEVTIKEKQLQEIKKSSKVLHPFVHVHGLPLHVILVYLDRNFKVRNVFGIKNVEVSFFMDPARATKNFSLNTPEENSP